MHIFNTDLYFDVTFNSWQTSAGGGGFSYTRTHVDENGQEVLQFQNNGIIGPQNSVALQDTSFTKMMVSI